MSLTLSVAPAKRNVTLDVLRGLAVILVWASHAVILPGAHLLVVVKAFRGALISVSRGGWIGVDLFFVLSGFLVSGLLFNEYKRTGSIKAGRFLIRRGFKIYPSFYLFMGVSILLGLADHAFYHPFSQYIGDLLFVRNYLPGNWIYWHTWSLDVEEHFYILLTIAFLVALRFRAIKGRTLIATYIILLLAGFCFRLAANLQNPGFDFVSQYAQTHIRLDALFFGVVLSYFNIFQNERLTGLVKKHKKLLVAVSLLLLLPNFIFLRNTHHLLLSSFFLGTNPLCFGALLMAALNTRSALLNNRLIAYIGRNSYNIYLWHFLVNLALINVLPRWGLDIETQASWFVYLMLYASVSLVTGVVFTKIVEEPFLKLRNKLYPSRTKVLVLPTSVINYQFGHIANAAEIVNN